MKKDTPTDSGLSDRVGAGKKSPKKRRTLLPETPLVHLSLFLLTILTVTSIYMLIWSAPTSNLFQLALDSFAFACALLSILLSHELGHYIAAKKHGIEATLPYFIPFPYGIGTFGAFIQIKGKIRTRKQLLDLGASGPLAGIVVAVLIGIAGVLQSKLVAQPAVQTGPYLEFGEPLVLKALIALLRGPLPDHFSLSMSPLLLAAWVGFLVTALNLLPASQLDGGHIVYAVFGRFHRFVSRAIFLGLVGWGVWGEGYSGRLSFLPTAILISVVAIAVVVRPTVPKLLKRTFLLLVIAHIVVLISLEIQSNTMLWLIWGLILLSFRLDHPKILDDFATVESGTRRLDRTRVIVGILTLLVFVSTFMLIPIRLVETAGH